MVLFLSIYIHSVSISFYLDVATGPSNAGMSSNRPRHGPGSDETARTSVAPTTSGKVPQNSSARKTRIQELASRHSEGTNTRYSISASGSSGAELSAKFPKDGRVSSTGGKPSPEHVISRKMGFNSSWKSHSSDRYSSYSSAGRENDFAVITTDVDLGKVFTNPSGNVESVRDAVSGSRSDLNILLSNYAGMNTGPSEGETGSSPSNIEMASSFASKNGATSTTTKINAGKIFSLIATPTPGSPRTVHSSTTGLSFTWDTSYTPTANSDATRSSNTAHASKDTGLLFTWDTSYTPTANSDATRSSNTAHASKDTGLAFTWATSYTPTANSDATRSSNTAHASKDTGLAFTWDTSYTPTANSDATRSSNTAHASKDTSLAFTWDTSYTPTANSDATRSSNTAHASKDTGLAFTWDTSYAPTADPHATRSSNTAHASKDTGLAFTWDTNYAPTADPHATRSSNTAHASKDTGLAFTWDTNYTPTADPHATRSNNTAHASKKPQVKPSNKTQPVHFNTPHSATGTTGSSGASAATGVVRTTNSIYPSGSAGGSFGVTWVGETLRVLSSAEQPIRASPVKSSAQAQATSVGAAAVALATCRTGIAESLAHPGDCSKYIECTADNRRYIRDCAGGTLFDPRVQRCEHANMVTCNTPRSAMKR